MLAEDDEENVMSETVIDRFKKKAPSTSQHSMRSRILCLNVSLTIIQFINFICRETNCGTVGERVASRERKTARY
jgi:hypothetical protein